MKNDIVFEASADGGLLECVRRELAGLPGGKAKSFLEHRLISVDGLVTSKYDFPVRRGQTIRIRQSGGGSYASPLEVLYEDDDLLAVNKPAGLLTVSTDTEKERTAYRLLKDSGVGPIFVVHRLDRDTSGVLLFAKSAEMRDELQRGWEKTRRREYLAICEGVFAEKSGRCDTLLRESSAHVVYSAPYGDGRRAVTNYEVIKENARYSFLRVLIETGRKNQIRVHMKELGHPVVGDKKYGAAGNPLKRLGLHASCLEIIHPRTGAPVTIKAAPDRAFRLPKENR
jgi:23S rRNA pseudouridine1911/1915/1917 synthase